MYAQFEDFLCRSREWEIQQRGGCRQIGKCISSAIADHVVGGKPRGRIILMEEVPNTFLSTSVALRSFRSVGGTDSLNLVVDVVSTRIILMEEFPNTFLSTLVTLRPFLSLGVSSSLD